MKRQTGSRTERQAAKSDAKAAGKPCYRQTVISARSRISAGHLHENTKSGG